MDRRAAIRIAKELLVVADALDRGGNLFAARRAESVAREVMERLAQASPQAPPQNGFNNTPMWAKMTDPHPAAAWMIPSENQLPSQGAGSWYHPRFGTNDIFYDPTGKQAFNHPAIFESGGSPEQRAINEARALLPLENSPAYVGHGLMMELEAIWSEVKSGQQSEDWGRMNTEMIHRTYVQSGHSEQQWQAAVGIVQNALANGNPGGLPPEMAGDVGGHMWDVNNFDSTLPWDVDPNNPVNPLADQSLQRNQMMKRMRGSGRKQLQDIGEPYSSSSQATANQFAPNSGTNDYGAISGF
jgi:hypothetical protein